MASPGGRRLALELLFVIVPYLVTATSYAMWWAGWSAPARFANPAVFLLAIPCAVLWASAGHRATRVVAAAALAMTAAMSVLLVTTDGGRLAYNTRETTALWLDWASSLVPLGEGLPVWYRGQEGIFARDVAIWAAILAAAFLASRALAALPALRDAIRYATAVAAAGAIAFMVAVGVTWGVKRTETLSPAPAQLAALRRLAEEPRLVPVTLSPPGPVDRATLLAMMRIEAASRGGGGRGRDEQPMVSLPRLPAGRYRDLGPNARPGRLAPDRPRTGSVRAAQRAADLPAGAARDRFAGCRARAGRPRRRRRAPRPAISGSRAASRSSASRRG